MFRRFSVNFAVFSIFVDTIAIILALALSSFLRPILSYLPFAADIYQPTQLPGLLYPLFSFAWIAILLLLNVYDGRRNLRVTDEITSLTLGTILATVSLSGTLYLSYRQVSRLLFIVFIITAYLFLLSWRLVARLIYRQSNGRSIQQRRVLIIGAGPVGRQLQSQIVQYPYLGLTVVGFLDDDPVKRDSEEEVLGPLSDSRRIIAEFGADDVVIALPSRAYERVDYLVAELHTLPVKVWIIPDYFHLALHKAVSEEFAGIPMLDLRAPAINDYQRMLKRFFDLIVTLVLLPPALLLMGLIAIAIRLEGQGPIFFRQERVGENGRIFKMLKFRSMVVNAEELRNLVEYVDEKGQFIHKRVDDPRVTRIGHILRKTSFDELPQLFNIIKGDMSLVGPRPELPYLVDNYEPWQRKRFAVPQGITGWWQINGRSDKPMHLNTEDDLYYVQHYSLLLDLQILLKTVLVVVRGKGAF